MPKTGNPFQPTRWERHSPQDALIWFSPYAEKISEPRSFYISGTRGSGKTTILRSVHWKDLLENRSLKSQRAITDFEQIGIYLRFPDHIASTGDIATIRKLFGDAGDPEQEYGIYFSLIIELLCGARVLEAAHNLRVAEKVSISAAGERSVVEDIAKRYPELFAFSSGFECNFLDASREMDRFASMLNRAIHRGHAIKATELSPAREIGALLNFVCGALSAASRLVTISGAVPPAFRFCLDDCEVLSPLQQKTLNTLVRLSKFPSFWVVAYVGSLVNSRTTFLDSQPLTDADRTLMALFREAVGSAETAGGV